MSIVPAAARRVPRTLAVGAARHGRTYASQQQPVAYHQQEVDPQLAGYPQLPYISRQRLPAKGWWDPQMRRNFGDTMHETEEALSMWAPDVPPVDPRIAIRHFALALAVFGGIVATSYYGLPRMPAVRREYPYDGLVAELGGVDVNKARVTATTEEEDI